MIHGLGDAIRGGEGDEDIETAIVLGGGGEVEGCLDAELRVACCRHCFDSLLGGCGGILITLLRC